MWMLLVRTHRVLVLMICVGKRCGSGIEWILSPGRYLPLLFSYPCIVWKIQVLHENRNLHRQCQILAFHPVFLVQMFVCVSPWSNMVSSIAGIPWYIHMVFWWSHMRLAQFWKGWIRYISLRSIMVQKRLTVIQGDTLALIFVSVNYRMTVVLCVLFSRIIFQRGC